MTNEQHHAAQSMAAELRQKMLDQEMPFSVQMAVIGMIISNIVLDSETPRDKWVHSVAAIQGVALHFLDNVKIVKTPRGHNGRTN